MADSKIFHKHLYFALCESSTSIPLENQWLFTFLGGIEMKHCHEVA